MAYGKGSPGFPKGTKTFSFNLKTKDLPAPIFEVLTKPDGQDKSVKIDEATRVSGELIGIRNKEFQYKAKTIVSVTATLRDGNEVYFVSLPYTYLGRNIMNSLAALPAFDNVEISVYKGKPKEPGKEGFDSATVRQNGEMIYGKHEYKDLPPVTKVKVGNDTFGDSTAVDALFRKEIAELDARIKTRAPVVANDSVAPEGGAAEEDSSIPF